MLKEKKDNRGNRKYNDYAKMLDIKEKDFLDALNIVLDGIKVGVNENGHKFDYIDMFNTLINKGLYNPYFKDDLANYLVGFDGAVTSQRTKNNLDKVDTLLLKKFICRLLKDVQDIRNGYNIKAIISSEKNTINGKVYDVSEKLRIYDELEKSGIPVLYSTYMDSLRRDAYNRSLEDQFSIKAPIK